MFLINKATFQKILLCKRNTVTWHPQFPLTAVQNSAIVVIDIDNRGWNLKALAKNRSQKTWAIRFADKLSQARSIKGNLVFVLLVLGLELNPQYRRIECEPCCGLPDFLNHQHEREPVFLKVASDAFTNPSLEAYLRSQAITHLFLMGFHTLGCVRATALGAIREGFNVTLVEDCTFPRLRYTKKKQEWIKGISHALLHTGRAGAPIVAICSWKEAKRNLERPIAL